MNKELPSLHLLESVPQTELRKYMSDNLMFLQKMKDLKKF